MSDASDNRNPRGLALTPGTRFPPMLHWQKAACPCSPPALCSLLHQPGQTVNQPGPKPAWMGGGWFWSRTCPAAQHPAEMLMLAVKRSPGSWMEEGGYAAKASSTCLETILEAQRGTSCPRKQARRRMAKLSLGYRNCGSIARHGGDRRTDEGGGMLCGLQQGEWLPAPAVIAWGLKSCAADLNGANPSLS